MYEPKIENILIKNIQIPGHRLFSRLKGLRREGFSASIKADGQLEPIIVFKDKKGILWLGDGFHRLKEAEKLSQDSVQALVYEGSEEDAVAFSVKANVHRGKLNPGNLAKTLHFFHSEKGWTVSKIAKEFNLSRSYVDKLLQIASGNPQILKQLEKGEITTPEAYRALKIGLKNPNQVRKKCAYCDDYINPDKLNWRPFHAECAYKVDRLIQKEQMDRNPGKG